MRLAMALGMTLGQLKAQMTTAELRLWMAYSGFEPIGEQRADMRNGMLCALYGNSVRGKGQKKLSISDFLISPDGSDEESKAKRVGDKIMSIFGVKKDK